MGGLDLALELLDCHQHLPSARPEAVSMPSIGHFKESIS
jgi:hypothetical protein